MNGREKTEMEKTTVLLVVESDFLVMDSEFCFFDSRFRFLDFQFLIEATRVPQNMMCIRAATFPVFQ